MAPPPATIHDPPTNNPQHTPTPIRLNLTPITSYLRRLPLVTTIITILTIFLYLIQLVLGPSIPITKTFALSPNALWWREGGANLLGELHRLNTYPLVHKGLLHVLFNLLAFVPLAERIERAIGSVTWAGLVLGPLVTFPAVLYLVIEIGLFRGYTEVMGLSALILTLITTNLVHLSHTNPHLPIPSYLPFPPTLKIRTLTGPIILVGFYFIVSPSSSILGHLCGVAIGYLYGFGYLKRLEPPEWLVGKIEERLRRWGVLGKLVGWGWVGADARSGGVTLGGQSDGTAGGVELGQGVGGSLPRPNAAERVPGFGGSGGNTRSRSLSRASGGAFVGVGRPLGS